MIKFIDILKQKGFEIEIAISDCFVAKKISDHNELYIQSNYNKDGSNYDLYIEGRESRSHPIEKIFHGFVNEEEFLAKLNDFKH